MSEPSFADEFERQVKADSTNARLGTWAWRNRDRILAALRVSEGSWYNGEDIDRMVREIDVALHGNGAAPQAMLCDVVIQICEAARIARIVREPTDEQRHAIADAISNAFTDEWAHAAFETIIALANEAGERDG